MATDLIFLLDRDKASRQEQATMLVANGYRVVQAESWEIIEEKLRTALPSMLVTEMDLAGVDGIEACRRCRRDYRTDLPILFLTAHDRLADLEACLEAGGNDFVIKTNTYKLIERLDIWAYENWRATMEERRQKALARVKEARGEGYANAADLENVLLTDANKARMGPRIMGPSAPPEDPMLAAVLDTEEATDNVKTPTAPPRAGGAQPDVEADMDWSAYLDSVQGVPDQPAQASNANKRFLPGQKRPEDEKHRETPRQTEKKWGA